MNDPCEIAQRVWKIREQIEYLENLLKPLKRELSELMDSDIFSEGESIPFCNWE